MKMIQVGVEYGNFVVRIFAHSPPEERALRSPSGKCEPIFKTRSVLSGFDERTGRQNRKKTPQMWCPILVTRTGIEPMLQPWKGRVLTAWPTGLVAEMGFEPMTCRVWTGCSSHWAIPPLLWFRPCYYTTNCRVCQHFFDIFLFSLNCTKKWLIFFQKMSFWSFPRYWQIFVEVV